MTQFVSGQVPPSVPLQPQKIDSFAQQWFSLLKSRVNLVQYALVFFWKGRIYIPLIRFRLWAYLAVV